MVEINLKNILKRKNSIFNINELYELKRDIQRGNDMLLEDFGSQENVDAHLQEVKKELYQKLFSTPVTCDKPNCFYLS